MSRTEDDLIRRTRRVVFATVALLICGLVGTVVWWRLHLGNEVNGRLRALQRAGLPTSGAELNQWYASVPDPENAALVMTQAFALMRTFPDQRSNEVSRFKTPPRGQPLTPDQLRLLSDYVSLNVAALAKAKEAIQLPKSRFPLDFSLGLDTPMSHLSRLKTLAQTACDEALLAIESRRPQDATPPLVITLGLAQTLNEEPIVISQLVRIAVLGIAAGILETRLNAGDLSETEFNALTPMFAAAEKSNLMARALAGESAMAIPYFHMGLAGINRLVNANEEAPGPPSGPPLPGRPPLLVRATGFFERDLRFYLHVMETNAELARLGPPRSLGSTNLNEKIEVRTKRGHYILSGVFLPSLSRAMVKEAGGLALVRISGTALAVERFRLVNNRLPKDPHELAPRFLPAVPLDPFDGAPLRYKPLAKGYVVYSIGPDGHDDGGKEPPVGRRGTEQVAQDITITVER